MKKRILSIVLAVLMLVSVLPTTALAAEESVVPQNIVTAEHGGVKVEKRAEWTDEKNGKAKITFTLTGGTMTSQDIPVTDIVLVIDKSASMSKNGSPKMNNAKKAAVSFVDKFFGTGADQGYKDKVRIAVVSYSGSADTVVGLTNKINDLTSGINNIKADGGTHIQAGIYRAQQILDADNREKVKKLIVVLSDGEPTYSYAFTATGTFTGCTKTEWWESCNARLTSHGAFTADYTKRLGAGTSFSGMETDNGIFSWNWENSGNAYVSGTCNKNHDRTQYGAYAVNGTFTANGSSNHGVGTIWEANQAKAKGTEIFAVGFGLGADDTNAINTMKGVATDDDHYKAATTSDISHIFDTIADTITKAIAKDATLTDPLGTGFTLTTEGGTTYSENIDELSGTETIEFEIQYDTAHPAAGDTLPTNDGATLTYTDADGKPQIIHIGNPELENLAKKVTYVDENNTAYTDPAHQEKPHWYGDTVTLAPAPTKEGYTFNGWTTDDVTIGENDTFEMPKQNVTLKASWIKNEPTTMDITITKIWDKSVSTDRDRSAKIQLYANGKQDKYFYASKGAGITSNTATGTIKDRPVKDADGKDIVYTVAETEINGQAVTSDNQLVTEDEIWTGVVTGDAETGFTVTNSVRKNERYGVEVTKTATRTRTLADGTTETVDLVNEKSKVRAGDVIHYTVTIKNTGNVAFPAGSHAGDTFAAATGSLIDDATQKEIPSGSQTAPIAIALTEPNVTVTKTYTYIVLEADTRITNTANASIPNGTMEPERDSDAVVVTVEKPHGVTYTFDGYDTLPKAVQTLLPTQDAKKYYKGDSVNLPTLTDTTKQVGSTTYTFAGWHVDGVKVTGSTYTMDDKDVTFVGKWTSVTVNPKYKLSYVFKSGDDTITTLPDVVTRQIPADSEELVEKTEVELPHGFEDTADTVNKGTWSFDGWYEDKGLSTKIDGTTYRMPEGGKTLYGKWTFTKDEPKETTYTIEYYCQNADGENYTLQEDTDSGVAEIGKEKTIEPAEDKYSGYTYNETKSIVTLTIQEEADKNVFKVYYDAVPGLEVTKTIKDVTRDGEPLDPTDPEVEVKEGDVIEYEITVRNSGKLNLTDVVLTDEFTDAEGDLNIISGDDYTVDGYKITLENGLDVGASVTIKATYEVQLGDSGYEIKNKASGTAKDALGGDVTGESRLVRITPNALKAYRIFGSAYKYVKSEKGTFNKDGETVTFEFKVTSDKKGEEILDTFTIDVDETVKAGETSEGDWGGFDFNLSEEEFENLDKKEFNGKEYRVVYLWELKGDLKNMSYSTKRITLYLDRPNISYYSAREPMVEYLGTRMAYADPDKGADADIINIYGKQSSSGGTVKVGPQLNRDDHVAYIMGYPDGTVQPEGEITRAEACTIFFRLLTDSSRDYYFARTNDYSDVNRGDWFNNAISTLSNAGIVTGYNDGTFRPNQPITRGEMAKIIANFANLSKGGKTFSDLYGHWSKTYVELAAGNGWIAGYPDGSFRPDQKITRAETVTMINRVLERVPAKELRLLSRSIMLTFPDNNPGDWYYIAIQEASNSHEYQRSVYETTGDEMWTKLIDNVDWTKLEK